MSKTKIFTIKSYSNCFLLKNKRKLILVDTGAGNSLLKIKRLINSLDLKLTDINLIIITHVHQDHVEDLAELKVLTKADVIVHESEKELLMLGVSYFPKGTNFITKSIGKILKLLKRDKSSFKSVVPDLVFKDIFDLAKYGINGKIIHTPGHTKGSSSVIVNKNDCICGDSLFNILPNTVYPPLANYPDYLKNTLQKLRKYETFYPAHGKPFKRIKLSKTLNK